MTAGARVLLRPREVAVGALLATLALSVAVALGNPGVSGIPILVIALAALAAALVLSQTYAGYLVMATSCFTMVVVAATSERYINAFDLILPIMFPTALFGSLRRDAEDADRVLEVGTGHDRIREATRRFTKAIVVFYALAAVSIVPIIFRLGPNATLWSTLLWVRSVEGAMLFPLGVWWLRSERRMDQLVTASVVGGLLLGAVMLGDRITIGTTRPGMTWILNHLDHPTEDPNAAGLNIVLLMALVIAHHSLRPRFWNYLLMISGIIVLVLSQSRSGMLAVATFIAMNVRRIPVRYLIGGALVIGLGLLLAPIDFWLRMTKTVTMLRGSSELYSWMLRVYGYYTNVRVFLDNWLFGTGFFSGQFVSSRYNELGLTLGAENYYLETAVGMGVIGLAALGFCFVRMFQLGWVVAEVAPEGTLGHRLARFNMPLIVGNMIVCLTGNTLVGIVANAQLAVWFALLVRAGHLSLRHAALPPAGQPSSSSSSLH